METNHIMHAIEMRLSDRQNEIREENHPLMAMIPKERFIRKAGHISVNARLAADIGATEADPMMPDHFVFKGVGGRTRLSPAGHILALSDEIWSNVEAGDRVCFEKRGQPVTVYEVRRQMGVEELQSFLEPLGIIVRESPDGNTATLQMRGTRDAKKIFLGSVPLLAPSGTFLSRLEGIVGNRGETEVSIIGTLRLNHRGEAMVADDSFGRSCEFERGEKLDVCFMDAYGHVLECEAKFTRGYRGYYVRAKEELLAAGFCDGDIVDVTLRRRL